VDTGLFRTNVGLTYFRQAKMEKQLTDEQVLELYTSILRIEANAIRQMEEIAGTADQWRKDQAEASHALAKQLRDL